MTKIRHHLFLLISLLAAAAIQISYGANKYAVTNTAAETPGGARFTTDIGDAYTKQTMNSATDFIWIAFKQFSNPKDRKILHKVTVIIVDDVDIGADVAYTSNNEIHWNGNRKANPGLIEGIADYIRLTAGYAPRHWVKPGQGDRWDQGYDVTALFLDYCHSLSNGFVAELNKKMRNDYEDSYFVDLHGKSADQLWADYKAINYA